MVIVYCEACGQRIPPQEIKDRSAVQTSENTWLCGGCAPAATKSPTSAQKAPPPAARPASAAHPRKSTAAHAQHAAPAPVDAATSRSTLYLAVAGVVLMAAGIALTVRGRSSRETKPVAAANSPSSTPAPEMKEKLRAAEAAPAKAPAVVAAPAASPEVKPPASAFAPQKSAEVELSAADRAKKADEEMQNYRNHRAARLLEDAREFNKQNPTDPWSYQTRLKEVASTYGSAPAAVEARKLLEDLKSLPPPPDRLEIHAPESKEYVLVYELDLSRMAAQITYGVDNHMHITRPFDRIAYFLELQPGSGETQYLYVSMDAFTADIKKIGVPTAASGARFQQKVANLNVISNVKGIVSGSGLAGGNIEFWSKNYGAGNSGKVPNASDGAYDFGDSPSNDGDYGSMQVHNHEARQTLFAINKWSQGGGGDIGIGNQPQNNPDWTFAGNAGSWRSKRLRVLIRCK